MDAFAISCFVFQHLEDHSTVCPKDVQEDIYNDPNVEKVVAAEDIISVLEIMTNTSALEKIDDRGCGKWRRHVPEALILSLKHHGKRLGYDHNAPSLS
jgi:hypothetical protein